MRVNYSYNFNNAYTLWTSQRTLQINDSNARKDHCWHSGRFSNQTIDEKFAELKQSIFWCGTNWLHSTETAKQRMCCTQTEQDKIKKNPGIASLMLLQDIYWMSSTWTPCVLKDITMSPSKYRHPSAPTVFYWQAGLESFHWKSLCSPSISILLTLPLQTVRLLFQPIMYLKTVPKIMSHLVRWTLPRQNWRQRQLNFVKTSILI